MLRSVFRNTLETTDIIRAIMSLKHEYGEFSSEQVAKEKKAL
jgi:hypothetical protein